MDDVWSKYEEVPQKAEPTSDPWSKYKEVTTEDTDPWGKYPEVTPEAQAQMPSLAPKLERPKQPARQPSAIESGLQAAGQRLKTATYGVGATLAGAGRGTLGLVAQPVAQFGKEGGLAKEFAKEIGTPTQIEQEYGKRREADLQENIKMGGQALGAIGDFGYGAIDAATGTMIPLKLLGIGEQAKAIKYAGTAGQQIWQALKTAAPEAAKFAGYNFATSTGNISDRLKSAAHGAALMYGNIVGSFMPTEAGAKTVGSLINMAMNSPQYLKAIEDSKAKADQYGGNQLGWFISEALPSMMIDTIFGVNTPSIRKVHAEINKQRRETSGLYRPREELEKQAEQVIPKPPFVRELPEGGLTTGRTPQPVSTGPAPAPAKPRGLIKAEQEAQKAEQGLVDSANPSVDKVTGHPVQVLEQQIKAKQNLENAQRKVQSEQVLPEPILPQPPEGKIPAKQKQEVVASADPSGVGADIQNIRPAVKLVGEEKPVVGRKGSSHNDIIAKNNLKIEDIDKRIFVDTNTGNELSRERLADMGIKTEVEQGKVHSSDLAKAQGVTKQQASIPVMITRKMKADLKRMGYGQDAINEMTPIKANEILKKEKEAQNAISIGSTKALPLDERTKSSGKVGEGIGKAEKPAVPQETEKSEARVGDEVTESYKQEKAHDTRDNEIIKGGKEKTPPNAPPIAGGAGRLRERASRGIIPAGEAVGKTGEVSKERPSQAKINETRAGINEKLDGYYFVQKKGNKESFVREQDMVKGGNYFKRKGGLNTAISKLSAEVKALPVGEKAEKSALLSMLKADRDALIKERKGLKYRPLTKEEQAIEREKTERKLEQKPTKKLKELGNEQLIEYVRKSGTQKRKPIRQLLDPKRTYRLQREAESAIERCAKKASDGGYGDQSSEIGDLLKGSKNRTGAYSNPEYSDYIDRQRERGFSVVFMDHPLNLVDDIVFKDDKTVFIFNDDRMQHAEGHVLEQIGDSAYGELINRLDMNSEAVLRYRKEAESRLEDQLPEGDKLDIAADIYAGHNKYGIDLSKALRKGEVNEQPAEKPAEPKVRTPADIRAERSRSVTDRSSQEIKRITEAVRKGTNGTLAPYAKRLRNTTVTDPEKLTDKHLDYADQISKRGYTVIYGKQNIDPTKDVDPAGYVGHEAKIVFIADDLSPELLDYAMRHEEEHVKYRQGDKESVTLFNKVDVNHREFKKLQQWLADHGIEQNLQLSREDAAALIASGQKIEGIDLQQIVGASKVMPRLSELYDKQLDMIAKGIMERGKRGPPTTGLTGKPTEAAFPEGYHSVANAIMDEKRKQYNLPPRLEGARLTNPTAWDAAMEKLDRHPAWGTELVNELKNNPNKTVSVEEACVLNHETALREQALNMAQEEAEHATDPTERATADLRYKQARESFYEAANLDVQAGRESARALQIRSMMINDRLTPARMEVDFRMAKKDHTDLTNDERKMVKDIHTELQAKQNALDDYIKENRPEDFNGVTARTREASRPQYLPKGEKENEWTAKGSDEWQKHTRDNASEWNKKVQDFWKKAVAVKGGKLPSFDSEVNQSAGFEQIARGFDRIRFKILPAKNAPERGATDPVLRLIVVSSDNPSEMPKLAKHESFHALASDGNTDAIRLSRNVNIDSNEFINFASIMQRDRPDTVRKVRIAAMREANGGNDKFVAFQKEWWSDEYAARAVAGDEIGGFSDNNLASKLIKSIHEKTGQSELEKEDIRFSAKADSEREKENAPVFYSQLSRVIDQKMPARTSVQQLRNMLDPNKGLGIKKDEVYWSGLQDYLEGKKPEDVVTKEEIKAALKPVEMKEVVKEPTWTVTGTNGESSDFSTKREAEAFLQAEQDWIEVESASLDIDEDKGTVKAIDYNGDVIFDAARNDDGDWYELDWHGREAEYLDGFEHALKGAEDAIKKHKEAYYEQLSSEPEINEGAEDAAKYSYYQLSGGENYREMLVTLPIPTRRSVYEKSGEPLPYGEAEERAYKSRHWSEPNVLYQVRMNDRTVDGKKILHIEEIQSDWHQKGREVGYGAGKVPPAPFSDTSKGWARLALKRMIRYSAENGYDSITWTTGRQQVDRYPESLRQVADEIKWNPDNENKAVVISKNGKQILRVRVNKGGVVELATAGRAEGKNLSELIGKPMAERVMTESDGTIAGKDFTVGGKGMETFYDSILPSIANDIGKKFGAKPSETKLDEDTTVHSLDITPAMRDSVLKEGQPLFMAKPMTEQQRQARGLKATTTRMEKQKVAMEGQLASGMVSRPQRRPPIILDAKAQRLKADVERVKEQWQAKLHEQEQAQRTKIQKIGDTFVGWERQMKLSSPIVFGKLTSAALVRAAQTGIEELGGSVIGAAMPKVAAKAAREGGFNPRAESKAFTEAFTSGMRDAGQTLKTGKSELDILYGKKNKLPEEWYNFFGRLHSAIKAPVKRAEFARSMTMRVEAAIRDGVDVHDPLVQVRLGMEAYKDAQRSIFMQDNFVTDRYQQLLTSMEKSKKNPDLGQWTARGLRFLLPIVKVPTNIVGETIQMSTGLGSGVLRLAKAISKGLDTLKPEEADIIMRNFKKGALGAGLIAMGYFNPQMFGGYYQLREKREEDDVKAGRVRLFGYDLPAWATHSPVWEALHIGATVRRVKDGLVAKGKGEGEGEGYTEGMWAAALGITEEVPFANEFARIRRVAQGTKGREQFFGELAKGTVDPMLMSKVAEWMDNPDIKRDPHTIMEYIKSGVPIARQQVPEKEEKVSSGLVPRIKEIDDIRKELRMR